MSDTDPQWYLSRNGKRYGPFYEVDLDRFHRTKQLLPTDLLWHEGLAEWQRGASYKPRSERLQELQKATTDRSMPRQPDEPATQPAAEPQATVWLRIAMLMVAVLVGAVLLGAGAGYAIKYFLE
jgi:GYF domain 2